MEKIIQPNESEITKMMREISEMRNQEFDKKECIIEKIHNFHQAVTQQQYKTNLFTDEFDYKEKKKPYIRLTGKKKGQFKSEKHRQEFMKKYHWTDSSTLIEWFTAVLEENELKLIETKNKKENYNYNDGDSPMRRQFGKLFDDNEFTYDPVEVQRFDIEWYEFIEWYLSHEKETIKDFLSGKYTINEDEIIKGELKSEVSKIVMDSFDKKAEILAKGQQLKKQLNIKQNGKPNK